MFENLLYFGIAAHGMHRIRSALYLTYLFLLCTTEHPVSTAAGNCRHSFRCNTHGSAKVVGYLGIRRRRPKAIEWRVAFLVLQCRR
jgi:hypothetical protein